MFSWKEIIQNCVVKYSNQTKKITRPLQDQFGINYFTYQKIDNEGNLTVLVDRPSFAEHYVEEQYFLDDPFMRNPEVYRSGFCMIDSFGSDEFKKNIFKDRKELLNLDIGVVLIDKQPDCVEFFGFSGNRAKSSIEKLYLNHSFLLKSFASYFKNEFNSILLKMEKNSGSLLELSGKNFRSPEPVYPDVTPTFSYLKYLKNLGIVDSNVVRFDTLSRRERQCLKLMLTGLSANEIAMALELSKRTVESYFNNIKYKLSCWNKKELFTIAKHLDELCLL